MNGWWWNWYSGPACPASASFQPPAYHAQEMPFSDNRSPIVGNVWFGTSRAAGTVEGCGAFTEKAVFTAYPSGVTKPSLTRRSEEHTSELQSLAYLVCRLLLEKKNRT